MIIAIWIVVTLVVVFLLSITVVSIIRFQEIESKFHDLEVDMNNLSELYRLNHKDIMALEEKINPSKGKSNIAQ